MSRYAVTLIFMFTSLHAQVAEEEMSGIYTEALFFVVAFALLSIISYFVSKKNANKYATQNKIKVEQERLENIDEITKRKARLVELCKMNDDGLLRDDELRALKKWIYNDK